MKAYRYVPLSILFLAACAGSAPKPAGEAAKPAGEAAKPAAEAAKPAGTAAAPAKTDASDPAAVAGDAGFPMTPEEKKLQEKAKKNVDEMIAKLTDRDANAKQSASRGEGEIVIDPATGKEQQRIEKSHYYRVSNGRLYVPVLADQTGFPILREDDKAWYIPPPRKYTSVTPAQQQAQEALESAPVRQLPAEEAEAVHPPITTEKLELAEISEGLPKVGMWRENIALADLDGDGRPEIVSPPPRLSGRKIQIFRWDGKSWAEVTPVFDDPEHVGFEYGGVACADMDGDGKVDIVYGYHGSGPAIAYNKGGFHFSITRAGMPYQMGTRSIALTDLDGDGHLDVLAINDMPENLDTAIAVAEDPAKGFPRENGYLPGFDVRGFLWRDGKYVDVHDGLEQACYGYSISAAPGTKESAPFLVGACRYHGNPTVVYTYDRAHSRFVAFPWEAGEMFSSHLGTAIGRYHGGEAAFVTYTKTTPEGAMPNISGYGVTIYYRDGSDWKRQRVLKVVDKPAGTQGLAVGDLNGDGLDDVVFGDDVAGRVRVFLQRKDGKFEEIARELEPTYANHITSMRLADIDGDGRLDIVFAYQPLTGDATRAGGIRAFRNVR